MYGEDDGGFSRRETAYIDHVKREDSRGHHVDGCFYCGGNHPSDYYPDSSSKYEYWEAGRFSPDFAEEPYQVGQEIDNAD